MSQLQPFQPIGPTVLVGTTAVSVPSSSTGGNCLSYRVRNMSATQQYFSWGSSSSSAPVAPVAGTPSAFTIGMLGSSVETFALPSNITFVAGTSTGFEVTPGEGM